MKYRLSSWLASLVPGIITVAVVFGPSKVTITSKLGAQYGSVLLWIIAVAIFFMIIYTNMSARIGLAADKSILSVIRDKWGKKVSVVIGLGVLLVTTSFQVGNAVGAGISVGEFTHTSGKIWTLVTSAIAISLLFAKKFYALLSKLMIGIILLMLFSFLATCILSHPSVTDILNGLKPSMPKGSEGLIIAFVASCFSLVGAFYQSYLVQQRTSLLSKEERLRTKDRSATGMLILGVMSAAVMLCASSVLHPQGVVVQSAKDMGLALEPLFGKSASTLFLVGLFGASFSTLVGNAVLGGTVFSDAVFGQYKMESIKVKGCIAGIMILGAALACILGAMPLQMIVFAQGITILVVPIIAVVLLFLANDPKLMGTRKNTTAFNVVAIAGLALVLLLAGLNIKTLFFT